MPHYTTAHLPGSDDDDYFPLLYDEPDELFLLPRAFFKYESILAGASILALVAFYAGGEMAKQFRSAGYFGTLLLLLLCGVCSTEVHDSERYVRRQRRSHYYPRL